MCRDALPSAIVLFDSALEIAPGVKIFGTPWTGCEFPLDGPEMEAAFSAIPTDTTILMTHNPPFNILDLAWVRHDKNAAEECRVCRRHHPHFHHWGSKVLRDFSLTHKPVVHMFGHVHDGAPSFLHKEGTLFVNAAQDLNPMPLVFDLYL